MSVKILKVRLSSNPEAEVSDDGKHNVMSDGRLYFLVDVRSATDVFGRIRSRMIAQQPNSAGDMFWPRDPVAIKAAVGTVSEGQIVTRKVEPYELNGNTVSQYTMFVFADELIETAFRQSNHPLAETEVTAEAVASTTTVEATEEIAS